MNENGDIFLTPDGGVRRDVGVGVLAWAVGGNGDDNATADDAVDFPPKNGDDEPERNRTRTTCGEASAIE